MQKYKEKIERRWELEEPKKEIIVPTLKEVRKKGLSDEEVIMKCHTKYENAKCFREINGHQLCELCPKNPKFQKPKTSEEWGWTKDIKALPANTINKLVSKRR